MFVPDAPMNVPIAPISARDIVGQANIDNKLYSDLVNRISSDIRREYHTEYQDLLNKVAELSMKLNKQQSDLREFEKQRVAPLHELNFRRLEEMALLSRRLSDLEPLAEVLSSQDCRLNNIFERIEALERINSTEYIDNAQRNYEIVRGTQQKMDARIEKLESKTMLMPDFGATQKQYADIFNQLDIFNKRIEALENIGRQPSPWAMDSDVCELHRRITEVERFQNITHEQYQFNIKNKKTSQQGCQHEWGKNILFSMPPKRKCIKCDYVETFIPTVECVQAPYIDTLGLCIHGAPVKLNNCSECISGGAGATQGEAT